MDLFISSAPPIKEAGKILEIVTEQRSTCMDHGLINREKEKKVGVLVLYRDNGTNFLETLVLESVTNLIPNHFL